MRKSKYHLTHASPINTVTDNNPCKNDQNILQQLNLNTIQSNNSQYLTAQPSIKSNVCQMKSLRFKYYKSLAYKNVIDIVRRKDQTSMQCKKMNIQTVSNIELLKKQIEYLDVGEPNEGRFPKSICLANEGRSYMYDTIRTKSPQIVSESLKHFINANMIDKHTNTFYQHPIKKRNHYSKENHKTKPQLTTHSKHTNILNYQSDRRDMHTSMCKTIIHSHVQMVKFKTIYNQKRKKTVYYKSNYMQFIMGNKLSQLDEDDFSHFKSI